MTKGVCLVTGVGPGTGSAIVRRFSEEYDVAMLARSEDRLVELADELPNAHSYPCDVSDGAALEAVVEQIQANLGTPDVVVHNAVGGAFGDFMHVEASTLERNFQINTVALMRLGQLTAPAMIDKGHGAIVCTGNTSAYRGRSNFSAFAPTKAAQRILAESMARTLGPLGVHVAYLAIDAVIDLAWTRKRNPDKPDDYFCKPVDIAAEVWHLAHQPRSAWTFDALIRPHGETW